MLFAFVLYHLQIYKIIQLNIKNSSNLILDIYIHFIRVRFICVYFLYNQTTMSICICNISLPNLLHLPDCEIAPCLRVRIACTTQSILKIMSSNGKLRFIDMFLSECLFIANLVLTMMMTATGGYLKFTIMLR